MSAAGQWHGVALTPMSARTGIFVAYCFPEKKWFDRVHAVLKPVVGKEGIVVWDERRLSGGGTWKAELSEVLASRKVALLMVSDIFLSSDFVGRAKLPALLESEREQGLKVCWVLANHCLFELAGFDPADAAHNVNAALDGLGLEKRDAELAGIARHVAQQFGRPATAPAPAPAAVPAALHTLDAAIRTRHESILDLRRLARWMILAAMGIGLLALPAALLGLTHFLLLAGFAAFVACEALLVRSRIDFLGQGLIGMRYTRSGLADETLPTRQREPLVRRAEEIVG